MNASGRAGAIFLALAFLITACAAPQPSSSKGERASEPKPLAPKRITAAMMSDVPTISSVSVLAGSGTIQGGDALEDLVNAGLSVVDNRGTLRAQLAEAVPTLENGLWKVLSDGRMETTWRIRPGALWHDGAPFTADDPLFTASIGQDRDVPLFSHSGFDAVESVTAPDLHTVVVRWKHPYIAAASMFTRRFAFPRPKHVMERAYAENKESVTQLPYWTDQYVGTGPFKLRQWVAGAYLMLAANDRYVLGRPRVDEIEVRFIPDGNALVANILAGEVELTLGRNLSLQQALQIRDQWKNGSISVGIKNWIAAYPQLLTPDPPVIADGRFRRALLHAVDRQQLVDNLQAGMVPIAHTFLSPSEPTYGAVEGKIVKYEYDVRRASQLLESLGYARAGDGIFRDGAGGELSLEVRTDGGGGDDAQETTALIVADYWKRVGIATRPLIISQLQRRDREYNSTFPGMRVWRLPNDADDLRRYHSREVPSPQNRFNGGNRSRYMNPVFDDLVDRYMSTISLDERVPILGEIIHHMTDQLTVLGLYYNTEPLLVGRRLQHVTARDVGATTEAWNSHEWDVMETTGSGSPTR